MPHEPAPTVVNFVTHSQLLAERRLRKQSAAKLKELRDKLSLVHGQPQHQKMVPHEAMHSEKERRRGLEIRVEELEAEVAELRSRLAAAAR